MTFFANPFVRKARKSYRCDECRGLIQQGSRYQYQFGYREGFAETCRSHLECAEEIKRLLRSGEMELDGDGCRPLLRDWVEDSGLPADKLGLSDVVIGHICAIKVPA